jgi:hypothetical protein
MTLKIRKYAASLFVCFLIANLNFPSAEAWEKTSINEGANTIHEAVIEVVTEERRGETEKASLRVSSEDSTSNEKRALSEKQLRIMGMLTMLLASTHAGI